MRPYRKAEIADVASVSDCHRGFIRRPMKRTTPVRVSRIWGLTSIMSRLWRSFQGRRSMGDNGRVKSFRRELWFEVPGRRAFLNITREVADCLRESGVKEGLVLINAMHITASDLNGTQRSPCCLRESGVKEGLVLINAMHITASVFINDDEPGLHADYEKWLERLAPHEPTSQYRHNRTGEDNADAHMKRQVMGREVVVAVTGGKLDFGPWEQIFYGEFDGGRKKRALIKIIGE